MAALCGALALAGAASDQRVLLVGAVMLLAGIGCAGRFVALCADTPGALGIERLIWRHPDLFSRGVDLAGRVAHAPDPCPDHGDGELCVHLLLDLRAVILLGRETPARGRVRLRLAAGPESLADLRRGDRVSAFARLFLPRGYGNPGAFDSRGHLKALGIQALGAIKSPRLLRRRGQSRKTISTRVQHAADDLRAALLRRIEQAFPGTSSGRRGRAVAKALLLGDRSELRPDDATALQEAGLSHLLAVSGFNVAVLAAALFFLLRALGASSRGTAACVIPALMLYLMINRDESSVARSVVMAVSYLVGRLLWRRPDPCNTLGLAAFAILTGVPSQAHDAGFQLTFTATAALLMRARRGAAGSAHDGTSAGKIARAAYRWSREAAAVTLAATIGTWPLTALHFNRVTPGAVPANLLAGPLMAGAFLGVLALESVAPISSTAASGAAAVVGGLVDTSFGIADLIRSAGWLTYRRPTPGLPLVALYYAGLLVLLACRSRHRMCGLLAWPATLAAAVLLLLPLDTRERPEGQRVTVIDVGQGDCILLESPGGDRILVDAGGSARGGFDVGERVVSRALWDMGIASIGLLVVTHPDADHAGGAPAVLRNFEPRQIWVPPDLNRRAATGSFARLARTAAEKGLPLSEVSRGWAACLAGARLIVLHPSAKEPRAGEDHADNERSVVLALRCAGRTTLLAADAGQPTEAEIEPLLSRFDFLKVGHHGSRTASSAAFLARVMPKVAAISCGRENRFGHPHAEVLRRLEAVGARVCRTDLQGAISVELLREGTRLGSICVTGTRSAPR